MSEKSLEKNIKPKNSEESSFLRYKKRKGTTDRGKLYEEYFPVYVILQLLQNKEVKDFRISTNDEEFGSFDDLVLEVELSNKPTEKCAIQLKHINNRELTMNNLRTGSNFNIMKYYASFQHNNELLSGYKLILCTNSKFTPNSDATIDFIANDKSVIKVKITECDPLQFLKTEYGKSFQFQLDSENSDENKEKYKDFFDRLFLYTDQMNVQTLEKTYIPQSLGTLTSKLSVQDKFLKFISKWSLIDGTKDKLTKDMMIKVMTLYIVEKLIQPHTFCEVNEKHKLFRNAVSHFNITAFGRRSLENVVKIWGDSKHRFRDRNIKEINEIIRRFQICTKHIENIDDLTDEESTKLLWVMDECPLIIKGDLAAYEAAHLCGGHSKFVFITDDLNVEKLEDLTIMKTLSDLKPDEATYNNILKNLSFRLFGEETSLENLIKNDDAIHHLITMDEIAKFVDNVDLIKLEEEELCFPYIERYLYKNIIDSKYFQEIDKNTMILISNVGDEKKLRDGLQHFEIVSIRKELHKESHTEKYKLVFNKTETSPQEFTNLCNKNTKYENFHHFKYHGEHLEWIESIGDVSDLQKFRIQNENSIEDEKLCAEKIRSNLNIIVGDPGMGKSIFIKNLKNNLISKYFTVMIRPIDVPELCRFVKDPGNLEKFFTFIVESKFPNCRNFQKQILKQLMEKGKAIFLWDALDELSEENRIFVEKLIATLLKKSLAQFLTSRGFLRKHLEDNFGVLCQELDKQQSLIHAVDNNGWTPLHRAAQEGHFDTVKYLIQENAIVDAVDNNGWTPLHHAALGGHLETVGYLIQEKANVNAVDNQGWTPLHFAALNGNLETVKYLIREHANVLAVDENGWTPLHRAAWEGHLETLKYLVQENANVNALSNNGLTPLQGAALNGHLEIVKYLIQEGANVNAVDNDGWTPLQGAALNGHLETVKYLIHERANVNAVDNDGRTPLHGAALNGHLETVKYLIHEHVDVNAVDNNGLTPVHQAALNGHFETVKYLIQEQGNVNAVDDGGSTPLHKAASRGHSETVECLIQEHANVNAVDNSGWTPLHHVALKGLVETVEYLIQEHANVNAVNNDGWTPLHGAALNGYHETVECLIQEHANVNAADNNGWTPLHQAAWEGHFETVKCLVQENANVNAANNKGLTVLHAAALNGNLEIVEYLIQKDANVNADDNGGWTALHHAASKEQLEIVKYLIEKGANINAIASDGTTILWSASYGGLLEAVVHLTEHGLNVDAADDDGLTPLMAASKQGHLDIVRHLIQQKSDINASDKDGFTPLHWASDQEHLSVVKLLIEGGAKVDVYDKNFGTPLTKACAIGNEAIVQFLIESGASVHSDVEDAENPSRKNPLHMACENGHKRIVEILLEAGADYETPTIDGQTYIDVAIENQNEDIAELLRTHRSNFTKRS